jgi:hypothetical protein
MFDFSFSLSDVHDFLKPLACLLGFMVVALVMRDYRKSACGGVIFVAMAIGGLISAFETVVAATAVADGFGMLLALVAGGLAFCLAVQIVSFLSWCSGHGWQWKTH